VEIVKNIAFEVCGLPSEKAELLFIWGHGWGQSGKAFRPFAETLSSRAAHILIDFPGFGASPIPPETWSTADYAEALGELVRTVRKKNQKIIYAGHSFGGRVGIQLAARHPDLVDGLFLLASAGLPRQRSLMKKAIMAARVYTFKTLKHLAPLLGLSVDDLRKKFGSADYQTAGALRPIFLRVISENLSEQARNVKCPTCLVYGQNDTETPPEIGQRLKELIGNATLSVLPGQDHYSVLGDGRHVVVKRLTEFMETLK
jgi:pimeloyl-ACP methyl ester carboxylesterase